MFSVFGLILGAGHSYAYGLMAQIGPSCPSTIRSEHFGGFMSDQLNESEKRFLAAVERLSKASIKAEEKAARVTRLEAENKVLANGLAQSKADYQELEKAFHEVKALVGQRQEGGGGESKALKDQLEALQKDHRSLDQAFVKLKRQHAELLESQSGAPMFPFMKAESNDGGQEQMDAFKNALRDRLDKAIARLERLSA